MFTYDTVSEALADLKLRGYTLDFNISFDKLVCDDKDACLNPSEFEIVEMHRFEGATNPADEDAVYAIQSLDGKLKGTFSMAFGVYAEEIDEAMLAKLAFHKN